MLRKWPLLSLVYRLLFVVHQRATQGETDQAFGPSQTSRFSDDVQRYADSGTFAGDWQKPFLAKPTLWID